MKLSKSMLSFLDEILSIPSVGDKAQKSAPYGTNSRLVLQKFIDYSSSLGFKTEIIDDKVGFVEFGSGDKLIGIVCHLDVVPADISSFTYNPFELTVANGNLYGRGIVDDKGPAVASLFAMLSLLEKGTITDKRVRLILGTDEERTCSCVEHYASKCEIPIFSITPDAEFPVIYAEKGIIHLDIVGKADASIVANGGSAPNIVAGEASINIDNRLLIETGTPAHASKPDTGVNAINKLSHSVISAGIDNSIIPGIMRFISDFTSEKLDINSDYSGNLTTNIGLLNIRNGDARITLDIRYPVTASFDEIITNLKEMASRYDLNITNIDHMPPIEMDKNSGSVRTLTSIWNKHMPRMTDFKTEYLDMYNEPIAIGGGTYARHLPNTIAFGIGTPWSPDQCHMNDEHISINDFEELIDILREAIEKL